MCEHCPRYVAEIDELRERVRQLEASARGAWRAPYAIRLSRMQEDIVRAMMCGRALSTEYLFEISRPSGGGSARDEHSDQLIKTTICHIRGKLKPHGLDIETVWGRGYRLTPDTIRQLIEWTVREDATIPQIGAEA